MKQTHQQRRESEFNSIQQFFFTQHSEAFSRSSIPRGSIVTRKKRNSTVVQQRHEAESFSVSSDSKFLYTIGKICARSGENIEEGLKAFNDFLLILDYFKTELDVQFRRKIHAKANYFIGMLFYQARDFDVCEQYFRKIYWDIREIDGSKGSKMKTMEDKLATIFKRRFDSEKDIIADYFKA